LVQAAAAEMESDQSPVAAPPQQNTPAAPGNLSASAPTAAPSLPTNQAEPAGVPVSRGIKVSPETKQGPQDRPLLNSNKEPFHVATKPKSPSRQ
jgi:hypothetical protein